MMEYQHLLVGLALGRMREDTGSGPPPVVAGYEADRLTSMTASAPPRPEAVSGRRRRSGVRRGRGAAPATVT
jgi:hypothetical protein